MSTTMRYANLDEFLRYTDAADRYPQLRELVDAEFDDLEGEIAELKEQLSLARTLVNEITHAVQNAPRLDAARADVSSLIESSEFKQ